ncbi:MAG TPA: NAD-dependent epimerase/dehydratase family protein [Nocardioidaceae bacterium]|nr:NAD-dependent epimerase/dehydratase family protein [Nocardioidaceae bacterium]
MNILVLGGTAWLSRQIAAEALSRGHDVTCAARGESGPVADGARLVTVDRDDPDALAELAEQEWEAVIDVTRRPSHARAAVAALADAAEHWTYISSVSVYADHATPHQDVSAPTLEPAPSDVDETDTSRYGELKRACEVAVTDALPDRSLVVRPGLVVGPGDPSGRFAYWPHHAAAAAELLVPGSPEDNVQLIDVRDLAAWVVTLAEDDVVGVLDGVGPPVSREQFVQEVLVGVDTSPALVWVEDEFLAEHGVQMWMGERSIPLWAPGPGYAGHMARDVLLSVDADLLVRPLSETARDTLLWLRENPDATVAGLTDTEHAELVAAAHRRT